MGINGGMTYAQIKAVRAAMRKPITAPTPAQIRAIKKKMAQGRPGAR
jgi:hypothetical protein